MTASNQGLPGDDIPRRLVRVHALPVSFSGSMVGKMDVEIIHGRGQGPTDGWAEAGWEAMLRAIIDMIAEALTNLAQMVRAALQPAPVRRM